MSHRVLLWWSRSGGEILAGILRKQGDGWHFITWNFAGSIPCRIAACRAPCRVPKRGGWAISASPESTQTWKCGSVLAGSVAARRALSRESLRAMPPRTRNERPGYAHRSSGRRVATAPRLAAAWRA